MITGPSSYISTIDLFSAHWAAVNLDPLAAPSLLTRDGTPLAGLANVRNDLALATQDVEDRLNDKEINRARVENAKRSLLVRSQELGRRLRGVLPTDSPFLKALPDLPVQTSAQEIFLKPMRDLANLWNRVNDDASDLELSGDYTADNFKTEVANLITLYSLLSQAEMDLKIAREKRNALQNEAKKILSAYRPAVEGLFPPGSPLVVTIPLLYAPAGRTPEPVVATASFDAATTEAVVTFTKSDEAELDFYEVRGVSGEVYDGDDEVVLGKIPKGAARSFRTSYGLDEPGTAASFKVYVVLNTGNEAGSKAVTVTRPVV